MARPSDVDILQYDYELVTLKRPTISTYNSLGEKVTVTTILGTNIKCDIQEVMAMPFYIGYAGSRMPIDTGMYQQETPIAFFNGLVTTGNGTIVTLQVDDIITRTNGKSYRIHKVDDWSTHINCGIKILV